MHVHRLPPLCLMNTFKSIGNIHGGWAGTAIRQFILVPEQQYFHQTARICYWFLGGITSSSNTDCMWGWGLFFTRWDSSNLQRLPVRRIVCLSVIIWQRSKEWPIDGDGNTEKVKERKRQRVIESVMDGDTEQVTNDTVWNRYCSLRMTLLGVNCSIHQQQTVLEAVKLIYNMWSLICEHMHLLFLCPCLVSIHTVHINI